MRSAFGVGLLLSGVAWGGTAWGQSAGAVQGQGQTQGAATVTSTQAGVVVVTPAPAPAAPAYLPKGYGKAVLPFRENEPIPPGYHTETRARLGLIIGGAIPLGVFYFPSALVGASSPLSADRWLLVPGIGPWGDLIMRPGCRRADTAECVGEVFIDLALVIDGVVQTAGAILLGIGLGSEKTVLVRNDARMEPTKNVAWQVTPGRITKDSYGLSLTGTF